MERSNNGNGKKGFANALVYAVLLLFLGRPLPFIFYFILFYVIPAATTVNGYTLGSGGAAILSVLAFLIFWVVIWIKQSKPGRKPQIEIDETQIYDIISYLKSKKQRQSVRVLVNSGECDIYSSKLGGEYYGEKVDGLQFLGQIDFADVPHIDGYPKAGLLQFFIDSQTDNPTEHKCKFRYFAAFEKTDTKRYKTEELEERGDNYPLYYKEMPLTFEKFTDHIIYGSDDEFDGIFAEITEKVLGKSYSDGDFDNTPLFRDAFYREFIESKGGKIGGNPANTWGIGGKHTELLLECHSIKNFANVQADNNGADGGGDAAKPPIAWGGGGIADFFISKSDLAELNFDDVLFVWER
jgi:uncharacterized protein YwqG